jgi:septum formation protein
MKNKIILGSSSKYRAQVLRQHGWTFDIMKPEIDEQLAGGDRVGDPSAVALRIAKAKCEALKKQVTEPAILICADQVVSWKGQIREKPKDEKVNLVNIDRKQAKEFLNSYAIAPAMTHSSLVVHNTANGKSAQVSIPKFLN